MVVARVGMQPGLCACRQDQEHPVPALAWLRAFIPELNRLQRDLRCQRSPVELTCRQVNSGCRLFILLLSLDPPPEANGVALLGLTYI